MTTAGPSNLKELAAAACLSDTQCRTAGELNSTVPCDGVPLRVRSGGAPHHRVPARAGRAGPGRRSRTPGRPGGMGKTSEVRAPVSAGRPGPEDHVTVQLRLPGRYQCNASDARTLVLGSYVATHSQRKQTRVRSLAWYLRVDLVDAQGWYQVSSVE